MSVLSHLTNTATNLVLSSSEKQSIEISITTLRQRLNDHFGRNEIEQLRFGSSTRGTILPRKADANSDIDYMVIFNNDYGYRPQTFIERLRRFAEKKYNTSEINQSHPTVVLKLNHIKFELVPAYSSWGTKYIPAPKTDFTDWTSTDPNGFNQQLSEKNQNNKNLIKPMIRLVKYWNAVNDYVYNSYELEQDLVTNIYYFCDNLKDYFYSAINDLSTYGLSYTKSEKVERAKKLVKNVKEYENGGYPNTAELEIKKLIPPL
jgi:hypothetical protein